MFLMFVWRATLKVSFSPLSFHDQTLLMNSPTISSCYLGLGFQHKIHDELTLCIFAPCLKCDDNHSNIFHLVPRTTTTNKQNQKETPKEQPTALSVDWFPGLHMSLFSSFLLSSLTLSLPSHLPHRWPLPFVCSLSPFLPHLCQGLTLCSSVQLELQVPVRCPLKHWGCRHTGPCPVHRFLSLNLQFLFTNAHFGVVSLIRVHRRLFVTFFLLLNLTCLN